MNPLCVFARRRLNHSANEIVSISGHLTLREVERYTKAAEQKQMARNAMARIPVKQPR
jgi:hypothetical protein